VRGDKTESVVSMWCASSLLGGEVLLPQALRIKLLRGGVERLWKGRDGSFALTHVPRRRTTVPNFRTPDMA